MPPLLTGPWGPVNRSLIRAGSPVAWQRAFDSAASKEAYRIRTIIIDGFASGGPPGTNWSGLSEFTILVNEAFGKTSRKVLRDDGDLQNSINVVKEGDIWFVGVHRTAKDKTGKSLVNIGVVHEFGTKRFTIGVTDKMRGFFFWLFKATGGRIKPLKKETVEIHVKIPARPFIGPVWDKEGKKSSENIKKDIATRMLLGI